MRILKIALAFHAAVELIAASGITSTSDSLLVAMRTGSSDLVFRMIEEGADVNENSYGWTLLHEASHLGQLGMVERLLAMGANPLAAQRGRITPILIAAKEGHLDIVKRLAEIPDGSAAYLGNALIFAANSGRLNVVEYLLERDASLASVQNTAGFSKQDITNGVPRSAIPIPSVEAGHPIALMLAAARGNMEMVSTLVRHGARADYFTLEAAINARHTEMVKFLIDHGGADVNEPHPSIVGWFPVTDAAEWGSIEIVALLIEAGATRGLDRALWTRYMYDTRLMKLLLENGADPNSVSVLPGSPRTRLLASVEVNHPGLVRLFLDYGADLRPDDQGRTPLDLAMVDPVRLPVLDVFVEIGLVKNLEIPANLFNGDDQDFDEEAKARFIRRLLLGGARNSVRSDAVYQQLMLPINLIKEGVDTDPMLAFNQVFNELNVTMGYSFDRTLVSFEIAARQKGIDFFSSSQARETLYTNGWTEERIEMVSSTIGELVKLGCTDLNFFYTVAPFLAEADEDMLKHAGTAFKFLAGSLEIAEGNRRYRSANGPILNEMIERSNHIGLRPVVKALFAVYVEESRVVRSFRSWRVQGDAKGPWKSLPGSLTDLVMDHDDRVSNLSLKERAMKKLIQAIRRLQ